MFQPINTRRLISRYKPITVEAALKDVFDSKVGAAAGGAPGVTLANGNQIYYATTYTALEACALVMGASQFQHAQVRTKEKDVLRALPDKALKDV